MLRTLILLAMLAGILVACGSNTVNTGNAAANANATSDEATSNESMSDEAMANNEAMPTAEAMSDDEMMAEDETMTEDNGEAMIGDETMAEDDMMDEEAMMHDFFSQEPKIYHLVKGWYGGQEAVYYDFGANTHASADGLEVITAPIYVLVTGFDESGTPQVVEGQHNIIDVVPGCF